MQHVTTMIWKERDMLRYYENNIKRVEAAKYNTSLFVTNLGAFLQPLALPAHHYFCCLIFTRTREASLRGFHGLVNMAPFSRITLCERGMP